MTTSRPSRATPAKPRTSSWPWRTAPGEEQRQARLVRVEDPRGDLASAPPRPPPARARRSFGRPPRSRRGVRELVGRRSRSPPRALLGHLRQNSTPACSSARSPYAVVRGRRSMPTAAGRTASRGRRASARCRPVRPRVAGQNARERLRERDPARARAAGVDARSSGVATSARVSARASSSGGAWVASITGARRRPPARREGSSSTPEPTDPPPQVHVGLPSPADTGRPSRRSPSIMTFEKSKVVAAMSCWLRATPGVVAPPRIAARAAHLRVDEPHLERDHVALAADAHAAGRHTAATNFAVCRTSAPPAPSRPEDGGIPGRRR